MRTISVNILAEDDEEWVLGLLNGLAQKRIIAIDDVYPAEGDQLRTEDLISRVDKAERGRSNSAEEAKALLGL